MFGISWAEFIVILLVAVLVIPARYWPDVARWLARAVKFIRKIVWKITDASEKIKEQIELEEPINDIMNTTTRDVLDAFSVKKKPAKKSGRGGAK
jgi:Sec-independent protein translocase protein TatA